MNYFKLGSYIAQSFSNEKRKGDIQQNYSEKYSLAVLFMNK